ncbi:MAG: DUF484 family protein [Magnetococcales bacterium]|nr:DUF484 family protein [Magnetococcales bacterium]
MGGVPMERENLLTEERVRAWLMAHDDFFSRHSDLLPEAIQASGRVLSLEAGQLNRLRDQSNQIQGQLDGMIHRIQHNESIYQAFHSVQMDFMRVRDYAGRLKAAAKGLEQTFEISRVTVALAEEAREMLPGPLASGVPDALQDRLFLLCDRQFSELFGRDGRVVIRMGLERDRDGRFFGAHENMIRSEALVPLRLVDDDGGIRIVGSLNMGGASPSRFLPSFATDLVQNLADILTLNLQQAVPHHS